MRETGVRHAIHVSTLSGNICFGHGRLSAALLNDWTEFPIVYQEFDSDDEEYICVQSENAISGWSELDYSTINVDLGVMGPFDIDLLGIKDFVVEPMDKFLEPEKVESDVSTPSEGQQDEKADLIPDKIEPRVSAGEHYRIGNHELYNGDCLEVLKTLPSDSVDSLVTDPPAGIAFMGKEWDEDKGGSKQWIKWLSDVMKECMRVLKPGAHGLVWALPRTSHWTATALEDAGFEIRDVVTHIFGSGFPKSLDISKAIDKAAGVEREILGTMPAGTGPLKRGHVASTGGGMSIGTERSPELNITAPSTPEAKQWEGFGTALKPASEHWILVRKPCSESTVAKNVLKWGCGGLNIDASRVAGTPRTPGTINPGSGATGSGSSIKGSSRSRQMEYAANPPSGRFPANLLFSHNPDCVEVGIKKVKGAGGGQAHHTETFTNTYGDFSGRSAINHTGPDGTETVAAWECTEGCAVALLDEQSGVSKSPPIGAMGGEVQSARHDIFGKYAGNIHSNGHGDSGGASRFFYCAKPSKSEKNAGLDSIEIINISYGPWENADLKVQLQVDTVQWPPRVIGASGTWSSNVLEWNTLLFGNNTSDLSMESFKSTTKMKTNSITESKILNWLVHSFTNGSIQDANLLTVNGGSLVQRAMSLKMCQNIIKDLTDFVTNAKCVLESAPLEIRSLGALKASHPTVKSTKLMSYLITMVTPPDGTLLDCFGGSGTTLVAAQLKGFSTILVEKSPEYCDIILARAEYITEKSAMKL